MRTIELTQGQVTLVADDRFEEFKLASTIEIRLGKVSDDEKLTVRFTGFNKDQVRSRAEAMQLAKFNGRLVMTNPDTDVYEYLNGQEPMVQAAGTPDSNVPF
jgi:hypothetical protein